MHGLASPCPANVLHYMALYLVLVPLIPNLARTLNMHKVYLGRAGEVGISALELFWLTPAYLHIHVGDICQLLSWVVGVSRAEVYRADAADKCPETGSNYATWPNSGVRWSLQLTGQIQFLSHLTCRSNPQFKQKQ